jgi:hypothetical protein
LKPAVIRLFGKLALFAPLGLFVVLTNYLVDPGNLFGDEEREAGMARGLLGGEAVLANFAFDELRLQQYLAEARRRSPDVLILGSSRAMPLSGRPFGGRDVVNASVSSASLEDLIALFELYEGRHLRPRVLFLGLEAWALNGSLRNPSVSLEPELQTALRRLGRSSGPDYGSLLFRSSQRWPWLRLASPAYFQASFLSWLAGGGRVPARTGRGSEEGARAAPTEASGLIQPDGSWEWAPRLAGRGPQEVSRLAATGGARAPRYLEAPPDRERVELLDAFLRDVKRRGVMVIVWLAPYHPRAYEALVAGEGASGLTRAEGQIRALGEAHGISVLGSYDPNLSGTDGEAFIDSNHLRRESANALVARQMAEARIEGFDLH